jgi:hypothetical protein
MRCQECRALFLISSLVIGAVGVGCAEGVSENGSGPMSAESGGAFRLNLGLPAKLRSTVPKSYPYAPALRLFVLPVEDGRGDTTQIGVNTERTAPIPIVASGMAPPEFVGRVVGSALSDAGLQVVPSADGANRILRLRLIHFYTQEGFRYHGEVRAVAEVRDAGGNVLFSVAVAGIASTWGRSLSEENYREVFGAASMDMAKSLLENGQFQSALALPGAGSDVKSATTSAP